MMDLFVSRVNNSKVPLDPFGIVFFFKCIINFCDDIYAVYRISENSVYTRYNT